ncbi:hypothetical protein BKI52_35065 [marine bacterium AO1-C]|nr:hypothetical protein BKI52_35065 [marine bacterium AO1-C]
MDQTTHQFPSLSWEQILTKSKKVFYKGLPFAQFTALIIAIYCWFMIKDKSLAALIISILSLILPVLPRLIFTLNRTSWQLWALLHVTDLKKLEEEAFKRGWFNKQGFCLTKRLGQKFSKEEKQLVVAKLALLWKSRQKHPETILSDRHQFLFDKPSLDWYQDFFIVSSIILSIFLALVAYGTGLLVILLLLPIVIFFIRKRFYELQHRQSTRFPAFSIGHQGVEIWIDNEIKQITWKDIWYIWIHKNDLNIVYILPRSQGHKVKKMNLTLKYIAIPKNIDLNQLFSEYHPS